MEKKKIGDVSYSLRDLRIAKGISQRQLAKLIKISPTQYHSIEVGERKPSADTVYLLSLVYQTSMDFIYHSFYRQHVIYNFTENELEYAMKEAKKVDMVYLTEKYQPLAPPEMKEDFIFFEKDI